MNTDLLRPAINALQLLAYSLLLWKLLRSRLSDTYRYFTIYIGFELLRIVVLGFIPVRTNLYGWIYFLTQPVIWCLYLLVILELYQLSLRDHNGLMSFGRRAMLLALGASTAVSLLTLMVELQSHASMQTFIAALVTADRLVVSSLLVFNLLLMAFLSYFPVSMRRNAIVHVRIFTVYFLVKAAILLARTVTSPQLWPALNLALGSLVICCLAAWLLKLRLEGEQIPARSSYRANAFDEERLMSQLDSINKTLVGSAKR